jgi:hypothetical protein
VMRLTSPPLEFVHRVSQTLHDDSIWDRFVHFVPDAVPPPPPPLRVRIPQTSSVPRSIVRPFVPPARGASTNVPTYGQPHSYAQPQQQSMGYAQAPQYEQSYSQQQQPYQYQQQQQQPQPYQQQQQPAAMNNGVGGTGLSLEMLQTLAKLSELNKHSVPGQQGAGAGDSSGYAYENAGEDMAYDPTNPFMNADPSAYDHTNPSKFSTASPPYSPKSPLYAPTSPPYSPKSPLYSPTSPPYSPGGGGFSPPRQVSQSSTRPCVALQDEAKSSLHTPASSVVEHPPPKKRSEEERMRADRANYMPYGYTDPAPYFDTAGVEKASSVSVGSDDSVDSIEVVVDGARKRGADSMSE